jgi:thioesterase domain-containing protein
LREPADAAELAAAGVTQLVLVDAPPDDPAVACEWARELRSAAGRMP